MRSSASAFIVAATLVCGCQQMVTGAVEAEPVRPGEVAIELAGPGEAAIVVPVLINGQGPFSFVLDTGATITCLDQELAARLELPAATGMRGFGAGIGGSGAVSLVKIEMLEVGEAAARDLVACTLDLGAISAIGIEAEGLLGLNFLKPYRMTLDFQRAVLRLETPEGDR
jgi:predicted aspartyl protease